MFRNTHLIPYCVIVWTLWLMGNKAEQVVSRIPGVRVDALVREGRGHWRAGWG